MKVDWSNIMAMLLLAAGFVASFIGEEASRVALLFILAVYEKADSIRTNIRSTK